MKRITLSAAALFLTTGLATAGPGNPGAHFIENWDLDGDGKVTLEEATERRGDVFASFDYDEDGVLNSEEYAMFDEARENDIRENGLGRGQRIGQIQRPADGMRAAMNDTNGDGRVSRDEFVGRTAWWINRMDRNGDGVVSVDDFSRGH